MDIFVEQESVMQGQGESKQPSFTSHALTPRKYPQVVKYMGSKAGILDFIASGLTELNTSKKTLVDLFAGACAISGGFGRSFNLISNDIQGYSSVIASTYLRPVSDINKYRITDLAKVIVDEIRETIPFGLSYPDSKISLEEFNEIEERNRQLIYQEFDTSHHLFTRVYSGTWWSAEQCLWIDAIRQVLDTLYETSQITKADFELGLTCLLSAMAYTSQGTGHYAQYRDANTEEGMADILKYRRASVATLFDKKFELLFSWSKANVKSDDHQIFTLDYKECLTGLKSSIVYADPPYAFVHYSRFYHAMETLVRYDYPQIQHMGGELVKGRYRIERHQSPFCIKTQVKSAFSDLFDGVKASGSDLLLSYSNTGVIDIDSLIDLATNHFGSSYKVWVKNTDHEHMTMGRSKDRSRSVEESLIIAKRS